MAELTDFGPEDVLFGICLVDFHHSRGPEVEYWCGPNQAIQDSKLWPFLPFQALPDGSHSFEETFTYFTLLYNDKKHCGPPDGASEIPDGEASDYTTLFAISCSRQIKSDDLLTKGADVTRSTVQKSVVVVSRKPIFGQIKSKLSIVTNAFFLQRDFSDRSIIDTLYENLNSIYSLPTSSNSSISEESQLYVGLCLRKIIYDFRKDILTILKAILLEKRILFYGSNVEELCNLQFGLISLIPNLLSNLQDCGSPLLDQYCRNLTMTDSFKSSDRKSVLKFLGFPLQVFGKGGMFSPYTPLQQIDDLKSPKAEHYMVGTSNMLLLEQKSQLCDVLINFDTLSIEIVSEHKSLQQALQLTHHDKKWIETVVSTVSDTWNEDDFATPKNSQFEGSEDFIRWQFEDYLTGLLSSVKLDDFIVKHKGNEMAMRSLDEEVLSNNPISYFNTHWVAQWRETQNYEMFTNYTDDRIFDLFEPKHVYNGTDTLSALQQRLSKSFQSFRIGNSQERERSGSTESKNVDQKEEPAEGQQQELKKQFQAQQHPHQQQSVWNSWKEYFNAKKKTKGAEQHIPTTKSIALGNSTPVAIGGALLSLGLNPVPTDSEEDSDSYNEEESAVEVDEPPEVESISEEVAENPGT